MKRVTCTRFKQTSNVRRGRVFDSLGHDDRIMTWSVLRIHEWLEIFAQLRYGGLIAGGASVLYVGEQFELFTIHQHPAKLCFPMTADSKEKDIEVVETTSTVQLDEDDQKLQELGYVPSFKREFTNLATVSILNSMLVERT
jgi:hypothetical protein